MKRKIESNIFEFIFCVHIRFPIRFILSVHSIIFSSFRTYCSMTRITNYKLMNDIFSHSLVGIIFFVLDRILWRKLKSAALCYLFFSLLLLFKLCMISFAAVLVRPEVSTRMSEKNNTYSDYTI